MATAIQKSRAHMDSFCDTDPPDFRKIVEKKSSATIVYEDEFCMVFPHFKPQTPVHLIIVPKRELKGISTMTKDDEMLLGHVMFTARKMAETKGIVDKGFRIGKTAYVINDGKEGGQAVPYLHAHLMGGRQMSWPPG